MSSRMSGWSATRGHHHHQPLKSIDLGPSGDNWQLSPDGHVSMVFKGWWLGQPLVAGCPNPLVAPTLRRPDTLEARHSGGPTLWRPNTLEAIWRHRNFYVFLIVIPSSSKTTRITNISNIQYWSTLKGSSCTKFICNTWTHFEANGNRKCDNKYWIT